MGIYFHIPYCSKACHYCDFHFSTDSSTLESMLDCMVKEVAMQKDFITQPIETIYFGGGTPSLLSASQFKKLIAAVAENFQQQNLEITVECNPDDLSIQHLEDLKALGINRLSLGIQSLFDEELRSMNRSHSAKQALESMDMAREAGFTNISVDIIFAIPGGSTSGVMESLQKLLEYRPEHFSAYSMTIEEKTVFGHRLKTGEILEVDDDIAAEQFQKIIDHLIGAGYEQYEISNFSIPGFESKHNSNYWKGIPYLGIGPGAHSYHGDYRQFNVRNNRKYIKSLQNDILPFEREVLSNTQKINEFILTTLRTKWGCDTYVLKEKFGFDLYSSNKSYIDEMMETEFLFMNNGILYLTSKGKFLADLITEKLFQP